MLTGVKAGDVVVEPTVSVTAATSTSTGLGTGRAFGGGGFGGGGVRRWRTVSTTVVEPRAATAATAPAAVIELRQIVKTYAIGDVEVQALRGVSLTVERGEFVAIMGASGSGKSTLMNIIGCLDVPSRGRYWLDGVDVRELDEAELSRVRSRKIGFIFQSFNLIPRTTALANIELPLVLRGREAQGAARAGARGARGGRARGSAHSTCRTSSRAASSSAWRSPARIVTNPALILADEPTGNLDTVATAEVMDIFSEAQRAGRTVVVITHEHEVAAARTPRRPPARRPDRLRHDAGRRSMRWRDNFRIAIGGITSNKLRSALTVLGVLIGVAAVVILVAVGTGSSQAVADQINRLGTNTLTVSATGRFGGRSTTGTQSQTSNADGRRRGAARGQEQRAGRAHRVARRRRRPSPPPTTARRSTATVTGSTPSYLTAEDYTVEAGSSITSQDVPEAQPRRRDRPDRGVSDLFTSSQNPLGQTIKLGSASFKIIGVLASKGVDRLHEPGRRRDRALHRRRGPADGLPQSFSQLIVQGKSASTLNLAQSEVESVLASANDTTVANLPFRVLNQQSLLTAATSSSRTFTVLLGRRRGDLAARRRHRRDEHHARDRHGAHARDRHPQGDRRAEERDPDAVPARRPCCCR